MKTVAWLWASFVGLAAIMVTFRLALEIWQLNQYLAFFVALLSIVPGPGNLFAAYAAVQVWGWSWLSAILFFLVSVFALSKFASWFNSRGQQTPAGQ